TPGRERTEAEIDLNRPAGVVEADGEEVAGVGILVGAVPFVETAGGELEGIGPGLGLGLVEMAAEDEVGPGGDAAAEVRAVGELVEGVVHEDETEAGERIPLLVGRQLAELGVRQPQLAGVVVIPAEPGGIEADEV